VRRPLRDLRAPDAGATHHGRAPGGDCRDRTAAVLPVVHLELPIHELAQYPGRLFNLNGRDRLWQSCLDQVHANPMFGQGLGAAERGAYHDLPHNEYLRLLVDGGLVGAGLYAGAALLWGRRVLRLIRPGERSFACALFLALGVFALTDNVLLMPAGLLPFFYLAVMRIGPARVAGRKPRHAAQPAPAA
jgi:O-antigen ligase